MFDRRVTLLVGHFGSGKTEIALNGALDLAANGSAVTIADLDVVKPYFRTRSARALLDDAGVQLLAPAGDNIFADLPIIVPQIRSNLRRPDCKMIMDVGGDTTGARVLGSLADVIPVDETDCLLVLNFRRPSTPDPDRAEAVIRDIEEVSRVKVTGLVSNTHLMGETDLDVVLEGYAMASETGRRLGIEVAAVTVQDRAMLDLEGAGITCPVFVLRRIVVPPFELAATPTTGPLFVVN